MSPRDLLTHEYLKGIFKSNFQLAEEVIALARYYIKSGQEVNADELLEDIRRNPDQLAMEIQADKEDLDKEQK